MERSLATSVDGQFRPPDELITLRPGEEYVKLFRLFAGVDGYSQGFFYLEPGLYRLEFSYNYSQPGAYFESSMGDETWGWPREAWVDFVVTTIGMEGGPGAALEYWLTLLENEAIVRPEHIDKLWSTLTGYTRMSLVHHDVQTRIDERRRAAAEYRLWWQHRKQYLKLVRDQEYGSERLEDPAITCRSCYRGPLLTHYGEKERTVMEDSITITGKATLGYGGLRVSNDRIPGSEYQAERIGYDQWQVTLPLEAGPNVFTFSAADHLHSKTETVIKINRATQP